MPSVKDIRSRITSVKNTQQITKAMKMVAASKLRRATMAIEGARSYSLKLSAISDDLVKGLIKQKAFSNEALKNYLGQLHPLMTAKTQKTEENPSDKVALVVIASDRGLCGAYNTNALKFAWKKYNELKASGAEVSLFFVGRKATEFFTKRGLAGHTFEGVWAGKFNLARADQVTNALKEKFLAGEFDRVELCYTEFKSALSQTAKSAQVLPMALDVEALLAPEDFSKNNGIIPAAPITEPSPKALFAKLLPELLRMKIYACLADSLASEFGARMTSMDNATRNAGEMISRMTLQANRLRQAAITKELMEIIGGAEALKG